MPRYFEEGLIDIQKMCKSPLKAQRSMMNEAKFASAIL